LLRILLTFLTDLAGGCTSGVIGQFLILAQKLPSCCHATIQATLSVLKIPLTRHRRTGRHKPATRHGEGLVQEINVYGKIGNPRQTCTTTGRNLHYVHVQLIPAHSRSCPSSPLLSHHIIANAGFQYIAHASTSLRVTLKLQQARLRGSTTRIH
jgi:hypothetical protein